MGKNKNRTADEIDDGIEWKVLGHYGLGNLRLQRTTAAFVGFG